MKTHKVEELVVNLRKKRTSSKRILIHIRKLKQALNHRLVLKKVLRVINFN